MKSYFVELEGKSYEVRLTPKGTGGYQARVVHDASQTRLDAERFSGGTVVAGHVYQTAVRSGEQVRVRAGSVGWLAKVRDRRRPRDLAAAGQASAKQGVQRSPMPGQVTEVWVCVGDSVEKGQPLLTVEAMKMQNSIVAEQSGTVTSVWVAPGEAIQADTPLIEIEP